jgi:hypothetical protein
VGFFHADAMSCGHLKDEFHFKKFLAGLIVGFLGRAITVNAFSNAMGSGIMMFPAFLAVVLFKAASRGGGLNASIFYI